MDIKQILYFKAVADCGSFAKASERLHISQPAISAQIGQLEAELNASLLERHARGVRLTPAGAVFLDHGRDILARLEQARAAVTELSDEVAGSVTIAMMTTIANMIAAPLLERAKLLYPKLDIRIFEALSGEISAWHASSRFDLSILYLPATHTVEHAIPFLQEQDLRDDVQIDRHLLGSSVEQQAARMQSRCVVKRNTFQIAKSNRQPRLSICIEWRQQDEFDSISILYEFTATRGANTIFPCSPQAPIFQRAVDYRTIVEPELFLQSYILSGTNRSRSKAISTVMELLSDLANEISSPKPVTAMKMALQS